MPEMITTDVDRALLKRLNAWATEQGMPLPQLAREILIAAERTHAKYDTNVSQSTRWIRRDRDGGCGLCDELEPLFEQRAAVAHEQKS